MTKMQLNAKAANIIFEALFCIACNANGGIAMDENGNILIPDEDLKLAETWVKKKFCELLEEWEDDEHEWEIEDPRSELFDRM